MSFLSLTIVVVLIVSLFASSSASLLSLTPTSLPDHLKSTNTPSLIAFVAPWCGHCQRAKPELEKAAKALGGVVHVATVDCEAHRDLCAQYAIQGFPTIKLLRNNGAQVMDYNGARAAKAFVDFAMGFLNEMQDPVRVLTNVQHVMAEKDAAQLKIVLLTNKKSNPTLFKSLALEFAQDSDKVEFLFVPEAEQYLDALRSMAQVNVEKVPAIVALKPSSSAQEEDHENSLANRVVLYSGKLKKYDLMDWVKEQVKAAQPKKGSNSDSAAQDAAPQQKPLKQQLPKLRVLESQEDLEKHCQRLCILGFTDGSDEQREILSHIAKRHNDHGFPFLTVASPQKDMAQLFGIKRAGDAKLSLVALRLKRKKMAKSDSIANETDAAPFLDRIAYGDATYEKLKTMPKFSHDEL